jgi:Fe2+ or Zn2+ uptake regulation protein
MARKPVVSTAILALVGARERHAWTLDDLHAGLAGRDVAADFSTVFRAAEKLVADGALRKLVLDDGRARFELPGAHHDHLHCLSCDELIALPCVIARDAYATLEAKTGVAITAHQVVLSGLCPSCRTEAAA